MQATVLKRLIDIITSIEGNYKFSEDETKLKTTDRHYFLFKIIEKKILRGTCFHPIPLSRSPISV
jgi:hypothetical protein